MTQNEMWSSDDLIKDLCLFANEVGQRECPEGYRIFSNFGDHGMPVSYTHLKLPTSDLE